MLNESFMSRANTIVCPGGKMPLAMQLIFTPMIWRLMERRRKRERTGDRSRDATVGKAGRSGEI
jgi:hypothetical protein